MFKIDRTLAAQVVNTVKDVCGRDVNFINQYGICQYGPGKSRHLS